MKQITPRPIYQKTKSLRGTPTEKRYYKWLHQAGVCCLTGYTPFEIAHTGKKAMSLKAPLWTCLPLQSRLHWHEEKARDAFWQGAGYPDHLDWAERLYDHFTTGQDPLVLLMDMAEQANREFIAKILRG